MGTGQMT